MRITIRNKLILCFGAMVGVFLVFGLLVLVSMSNVEERFSFVIEHDAPVIANANRLFKLVVDMETGQRGFCITQKEEFLEPYKRAIIEFNALMAVEKALVSDTPSEVEVLERIEDLVAEWQEKAARPEIALARKVALHRETGGENVIVDATTLEDVAALLEAGTGKMLLDQIRVEFDSFLVIVEKELTAERYAQVFQIFQVIRHIVMLLVLFSVLIGFFITIWVVRVISGSINQLIKGTKRVGSGDLEYRININNSDEIGELATAFNQMVLARSRAEGLLNKEISERKQAEEELGRLNQQNQLLLNTAGDGIYGLDLNGNTTFVNPAAARLIGWEIEDIIGKNQHALLHHTRPDGTAYPSSECPIYAAYRDGQARHVDDEVFWRKDGSSFPVEYTSTPIRNDQGEI